jgi:hypothetical protein
MTNFYGLNGTQMAGVIHLECGAKRVAKNGAGTCTRAVVVGGAGNSWSYFYGVTYFGIVDIILCAAIAVANVAMCSRGGCTDAALVSIVGTVRRLW